jgi:biopolymer transport protein ExbD
MSHGSSEGGKCEPNMTPLLDLVLQLVMFFMICANFTLEQTNASIKLPRAISSKALDPEVKETVFLNVDKSGNVLPSATNELMTNSIAVQQHLERRYKEDQQAKPPRETVIIVRADKETTFEKVFGVMTAARNAQFKTVQIRVIRYDRIDE